MELKKRFRLTQDDYIAFNFFHLKPRLIAIPVTLLLAMPSAMIVIALIRYGYIDPLPPLVGLLVGTIFAGLVSLINMASLRYAAKKQYESSKSMQAENDVVVDETGVRETGDYGNTTALWADMFKAAESSSAYCIFFSRMQAFVIPKRLLTPDEERTLHSLIEAHLPSEKIKLIKRG